MILKIQMREEANVSSKWYLRDNIQRLSFHKEKFGDVKDLVFDVITKEAGFADDLEIMVVCTLDCQDNEMLFCLDDMAYILNDDGKTIERIW